MKRLLLGGLLLLNAFTSQAQKHVYEDLLVLYVDENYEKCLGKAENYTMSDATKKDPLPYLYMSMCLYEMSKIEKYSEDYPKASRDCLKYAEKFRKKDKQNEYFAQYEDYWADLNTMAMEQGENYYEDGAFSKAKQLFDSMTGYNPENPGAWMMLALAQYRSNLVREGDENMKQFSKTLLAAGDISDLPKDNQKLLKNALMRYSEYLDTKGMKDSARSTLDIGKDRFMEEPDFKTFYESMH